MGILAFKKKDEHGLLVDYFGDGFKENIFRSMGLTIDYNLILELGTYMHFT